MNFDRILNNEEVVKVMALFGGSPEVMRLKLALTHEFKNLDEIEQLVAFELITGEVLKKQKQNC